MLDSRATDDGTAIRRRRACNACGKRFTTYERIEGDEQIRVVKRDGRIQSFDRRKVLSGIITACEKRPVPSDELEAAANRIQSRILADGDREITSRRIGELVMDELRKLDQVAYVRFASVYRQFKDLDELLAEVTKVIGRDGAPRP